MTKDTIFQSGNGGKHFEFNREVAEVFDDMLSRSVPFYGHVINMTGRILAGSLEQEGLVYDLGCSTGTTLITLAGQLEHLNLSYIGIDNSAAMLEKAREKTAQTPFKDTITFQHGDITETDLQQADAIIVNYTMQFIRPADRANFTKRLHNSLKPGGVLIVSEKVIAKDQTLHRRFTDMYLDFKREQGYSEIEISRKREALEYVLVPLSRDENTKLLQRAGFTCVETFFQWFNFVSFMAMK